MTYNHERHNHKLTYDLEDEATISAVCQNTNCPEPDAGSITLLAPTNLVYDGEAKLAKISGVPSCTVQRLEKATKVTSQLATWIPLCNALCVQMEDLLTPRLTFRDPTEEEKKQSEASE